MKIKLEDVDSVIVGINWGAIIDDGWFGAIEYRNVDLDLKFIQRDANTGKVVDLTNEWKRNGIIDSSLDDTTGDLNGNDELDNEYATINLRKIPKKYEVIMYVNNYTEQDLSNLSHLDYRIYRGTPNNPESIIHRFDVNKLSDSMNSKGILLGSLIYDNKFWYLNPYDTCFKEVKEEKIIDEIMKIMDTIPFG